MRKLYSSGGEGWILASQLHKAINNALLAAGGKVISRQMFYKSILAQVDEVDKEKHGRYLYVRADQVSRWVAHAELRCKKIQSGEWLARHPWGDDSEESFRASKTVVEVVDTVGAGIASEPESSLSSLA